MLQAATILFAMGKKKFWKLKLEVAYSARDVFGGYVPSHSTFISLFMVFLKLR